MTESRSGRIESPNLVTATHAVAHSLRYRILVVSKCCRGLKRIIVSGHVEAFSSLAPSYLSVGTRARRGR
jgi:hypothetical protein